MVFYHKGLRVCKTPLPFVACARKAAIPHVQIWSAHESDVVGLITLIPLLRSPLMVHTMPTKALLATTLRPLVVQRSSSLAHGARLIDHFLRQESTPQKMATFERA